MGVCVVAVVNLVNAVLRGRCVQFRSQLIYLRRLILWHLAAYNTLHSFFAIGN
jgi:hypothetical protein